MQLYEDTLAAEEAETKANGSGIQMLLDIIDELAPLVSGGLLRFYASRRSRLSSNRRTA